MNVALKDANRTLQSSINNTLRRHQAMALLQHAMLLENTVSAAVKQLEGFKDADPSLAATYAQLKALLE